MTRSYLLSALLLLLCVAPAKAQDTLWVQQQDNKPYLSHRIRTGENIFLLSRRYSVPPAVLADVNEVNYQDGLVKGSRFRIPIDKYNYIRIESMVDSRPLYYRPEPEDNLHSISRMFNVSQGAIQRWNRMPDADLGNRPVLLVGWIAYDKSQQPFPASTAAVPDTSPAKDTKDIKGTGVKTMPTAKAVKSAPLPLPRPVKDSMAGKAQPAAALAEEEPESNALARQFKEEDQGGPVIEESGAAVFYTLKNATGGTYYAFHNSARKGSVIKILNPASNKMIYAKVIGPVPQLKEYHNAIVGLSSNAMKALGARDRRMFCKLKYR